MKPYYSENGIEIYHGDCRDILPQLGNFDLVLTDPPYNVNIGSKEHGSNRIKNLCPYSDNLSAREYQTLVDITYAQYVEMTDNIIVTPGNSNQIFWPKPLWTMAWFKGNGMTRTPLTRGKKMSWADWEPILIYGKLDNPPQTDCLKFPILRQPDAEGHPCPKPLKLFQRLISFTDAKTILDPFMGSGTTLLAAKNLGRHCVGIEKEEKYCEIAVKRLQQEVLPFKEAPKCEQLSL